MGLLGNGPDDPRSAAIMVLSAGLLNGNLGQGLLGSQQAFSQAKEQSLLNKMREMQMAQMQAKQDQERAAMEAAQRKQQALPSLFGGGVSPGAFSAPADGVGPTMPQSAAPPAGLDYMAALRAGYNPDEIQKLHGLTNMGRQKVARTVKGIGPDGKEYEYQVDEFGQRVGDGLAQYRAPISVGQGDRNTFLDPYSLKPQASFGINQSPDSKASNQLGWANHALSRRGQDLADSRARETNAQGKVPAGYRATADGGLEFIPGGPADPNAAKRAAPTEFQGKSAIYGTRAQESDRIISSLDGKYSPAALNTKLAADNAPWYLGGGVAGAAGNMLLSADGQKAEQAQRDFINAVLRQESGAVISDQEFLNARKQYFPQPFDSDAVKKQKAANRKLAIQGIMNNARASNEPAKPPPNSDNDPLGLRK